MLYRPQCSLIGKFAILAALKRSVMTVSRGSTVEKLHVQIQPAI